MKPFRKNVAIAIDGGGIRGVVITRPREQSAHLSELVKAAAGRPIVASDLPAIRAAVGRDASWLGVAIDARAPLYDGGICTRVDCVSLGIMVNRDGERFYDEGEDFWPKRYAIWGRLIAAQPDGTQVFAEVDVVEGSTGIVTATKVADICSKKAITITEETTLTDIATIMDEKKVHVLPVVRDGKVVGIVGKRDVVRAVAQQAG